VKSQSNSQILRSVEEEVLRALLEGRAGPRADYQSRLSSVLCVLADVEKGTESSLRVSDRAVRPLYQQLMARGASLPPGVRMNLAAVPFLLQPRDNAAPTPAAWDALMTYLTETPLKDFTQSDPRSFKSIFLDVLYAMTARDSSLPRPLDYSPLRRPRAMRNLYAITVADYGALSHYVASSVKDMIYAGDIDGLLSLPLGATDDRKGFERVLFLRAAATLVLMQAKGAVPHDRAGKVLRDLEQLIRLFSRTCTALSSVFRVGGAIQRSTGMDVALVTLFGGALGLSMADTAALMGKDMEDTPGVAHLPAAEVYLCDQLVKRTFYELLQPSTDEGPREVCENVRSGAMPFAAEIYASLRCGTCAAASPA
jgi:hypothetical protein